LKPGVRWGIVVINYFMLFSFLEVRIQINFEMCVCWRVLVVNHSVYLIESLGNM